MLKPVTTGWFHTSNNEPLMPRERTAPAKTQEERQKPQPINLEDLNKEGKAPVNYDKKNGRKLPRRDAIEASDII